MDNFFNDTDFSTDKSGEEFFTTLVERALKGKQSDFEFIRSWQERFAVKTYRFGISAIIRIFKNLYKSTYKVYLEQVRAGMPIPSEEVRPWEGESPYRLS